MKIALGIAAGLVWGSLVALLNGYLTKKAAAKEDFKVLTGMSFARWVLDIGALAAVFFLRKVLPFSFEAAIITTAVALSVVTVVVTFKISKSI